MESRIFRHPFPRGWLTNRLRPQPQKSILQKRAVKCNIYHARRGLAISPASISRIWGSRSYSVHATVTIQLQSYTEPSFSSMTQWPEPDPVPPNFPIVPSPFLTLPTINQQHQSKPSNSPHFPISFPQTPVVPLRKKTLNQNIKLNLSQTRLFIVCFPMFLTHRPSP